MASAAAAIAKPKPPYTQNPQEDSMDLWWDAIDGATSILIEVPAPHCPSSSNTTTNCKHKLQTHHDSPTPRCAHTLCTGTIVVERTRMEGCTQAGVAWRCHQVHHAKPAANIHVTSRTQNRHTKAHLPLTHSSPLHNRYEFRLTVTTAAGTSEPSDGMTADTLVANCGPKKSGSSGPGCSIQ